MKTSNTNPSKNDASESFLRDFYALRDIKLLKKIPEKEKFAQLEAKMN